MLQLRPYQEKFLAAVLAAREQGLQRVLGSSPTGTGKTVTFCAIRNAWQEFAPGPALVLAHREELLEQAGKAFQRADPHCWVDLEQANRKAGAMANIIVASVQTLGRPDSKRLEWLVPEVRLIICDEAHHAVSPSYLNVFKRFRCFEEGGPFLLGVTATPKRLDQKNLRSVFQEQVFNYSIRDAINDGWLSDVIGYRVRTNCELKKVRKVAGDFDQKQLAKALDVAARTSEVVKHWQAVASDRHTIAFGINVEHAKHIAEAFREKGVAAEHIHGGMDRTTRRGILERHRTRKTQILSNVDVLTEGYDDPAISCVLMLRPTESWGFYCQAIGRGLRLFPGKANCIVIDVVDNCDGMTLASIPALLDLPPNLDLQGQSLKKAAKLIGELGERAALLERLPEDLETYAQIESRLEQVDLLAGITPPEEVVASGARLAWLKVPGGYLLKAGKREARIEPDLMGGWSLALSEPGKSGRFAVRGSDDAPLPEVIAKADAAVRKTWPGVEYAGGQDSRWRQLPPTENQIRILRRLQVEPEIIAQLNRGSASAMLDQRRGALSAR